MQRIKSAREPTAFPLSTYRRPCHQTSPWQAKAPPDPCGQVALFPHRQHPCSHQQTAFTVLGHVGFRRPPQGVAPGYGSGAAHGQNAVSGMGPAALSHESGAAPGYSAVSGVAPGYGTAAGGGYGIGANPGFVPGFGGVGASSGAVPGYGAGSGVGYGAVVAGAGQGAVPGYGTGTASVYGVGAGHGFSAGNAPGFGNGHVTAPASGYVAGAAPAYNVRAGHGNQAGLEAATTQAGHGVEAAPGNITAAVTGSTSVHVMGAAARPPGMIGVITSPTGVPGSVAALSTRTRRRMRLGFSGVAGSRAEHSGKMVEEVEVNARMWARAARMAALSDEVRPVDVYQTLRRLTAKERGEVPRPRLKNGEQLAEQLLSKARTLEGEVHELKRLREKARFRKDAELEEELRTTQRRVEAKLRGVDRTMVYLTAPDTCWVLSPLHPLRAGCRWLVNSGGFAVFTSLLLMYNCACLALERRDIPPMQVELIDRSNVSLNIIFAAEMVIRIIAMSATVYLRSTMNRLDVLLVSIGLADAIISLIGLKVA
jgi:hypothetical protein